jgi:hypothetical protein
VAEYSLRALTPACYNQDNNDRHIAIRALGDQNIETQRTPRNSKSHKGNQYLKDLRDLRV